MGSEQVIGICFWAGVRTSRAAKVSGGPRGKPGDDPPRQPGDRARISSLLIYQLSGGESGWRPLARLPR